MTGSRMRASVLAGLLLALLAVALQGVQGKDGLDQVPSEVQCRPYIEKALKDLGTGSLEESSAEVTEGTEGDDDDDTTPLNEQDDEPANDDSKETDEQPGDDDGQDSEEDGDDGNSSESNKNSTGENADDSTDASSNETVEAGDNVETIEVTSVETAEDRSEETNADPDSDDGIEDKIEGESTEDVEESADGDTVGEQADEPAEESTEAADHDTTTEDESVEKDNGSDEEKKEDESGEATTDDITSGEDKTDDDKSNENKDESTEGESVDNDDSKGDDDENDPNPNDDDSKEDEESKVEEDDFKEGDEDGSRSKEITSTEDGAGEESGEGKDGDSKPDDSDNSKETKEVTSAEDGTGQESGEDKDGDDKPDVVDDSKEDTDGNDSKEEESKFRGRRDTEDEQSAEDTGSRDDTESTDGSGESEEDGEVEPTPEEDLIQELDVPENLRPREHINQLLKLDEENEEKETAIQKAADIVLRDLKRLYDNAIKPLETLYKYRDLSNRHFGDPEIFSKPLVLFMGPWSGGKSSIINYLLDNEYKTTSLRTGAEPSPAYFNILMHGEEEEIVDGTQLAADWTFSGLQKFGQGMLDRLRGLRLKSKLLEKVNIVEIPGILEIRKQVQRLFPFNDACQWFIDRADIIFLVYDPSKLDVGPETEAILDQLKGREYQTRIILNKADQVKPEELMRVQGALIWNISPLMSSAEPPVMYSTSLWSLPYEAGAPTRLLYAQERAFLRDLRSAIDKRVEHKIASARRFAVRVRNHAKMVDCYLTTYYNHKSFFGNKKETSDKIIENPQDYHIYEGLSTLTNISRYDLPDPDVYKDFFRLNSLYDFQQLSSTCTYFRGCPINRLDVAIAYDLPELVGKYKKSVDAAMHEGETATPPS